MYSNNIKTYLNITCSAVINVLGRGQLIRRRPQHLRASSLVHVSHPKIPKPLKAWIWSVAKELGHHKASVVLSFKTLGKLMLVWNKRTQMIDSKIATMSFPTKTAETPNWSTLLWKPTVSLSLLTSFCSLISAHLDPRIQKLTSQHSGCTRRSAVPEKWWRPHQTTREWKRKHHAVTCPPHAQGKHESDAGFKP